MHVREPQCTICDWKDRVESHFYFVAKIKSLRLKLKHAKTHGKKPPLKLLIKHILFE